MTDVYYTSFADEHFDFAKLPLSEYRLKKLQTLKKELSIKQSIVAELLLNYAFISRCPNESVPLDIITINGKPELRNEKFNINLSHSGNMVACAISDNAIGIDVQLIREFSPSLPKRIFSDAEYKEYQKSDEKSDCFFKLWTLKESYVKMLGAGISHGLSNFTVDLKTMSIINSDCNLLSKKIEKWYFALCGKGLEACKFEYVPIEKLL